MASPRRLAVVWGAAMWAAPSEITSFKDCSMRPRNAYRLAGAAVVVAVFLSLVTAARAAEPYKWGNVAIFGGGFVSGIVTHPAEKNLIYCRTDIGGAYRWDEPARRWVAITDWISGPGWNYTGIESLAIDPSDPN